MLFNIKYLTMMTTDIKILELIELLKASGKIKSTAEFCREIGFMRQNIRRVKSGDTSFTLSHVKSACEVYNVNANWIIGTSKTIFNSLHKVYTKPVKTALK